MGISQITCSNETTNKEIWSVKTCTNLESSRYVIVAFQTNRKDNKSQDITNFDNTDISNIKLDINSEYYPYEDMKLSFDSHKYVEAYYMLLEKTIFFNLIKLVYLFYLYNAYIRVPTLFVIDCSKRNYAIKTSTIDVKLEIESRTNFPADTKAYCINIHDSVGVYR
ncbi:hypothetical protein NQ318_023574 [Aromia moschata]|uniref:Double jelly roll-like domain-containing protein n=1 Tax=Aromia moschata TaxID=1265417 RepID=A0AAV8YNV7_9CUCU|nr:hypothetical protein NQ318_023574 [Aromia moschata]